jgi:hypothetical protein
MPFTSRKSGPLRHNQTTVAALISIYTAGKALKRKRIDQLYFDPKTALARLEKTGDLFADVGRRYTP